MNNNYKVIHPQFRLNGIAFSFDDLKEVGYCLIKEGLPFEIAIGNFLIDWVNDDAFVYVKTSGSTGSPKQIKLEKQHMVNSAMATGSFFNLKSGDSALLCLPTEFIAGKMMLVRAMVLGLKLDYVAPNSKPLENNSKVYDFSAMIPLQLENSITHIESIKKLIVGGAKMSSDLIGKVQDKSTAVFETYGMTETITHIAVKEIHNAQQIASETFKALPDVTFKTDQRNCLVIHAPSIATEKVVTNDLVNLISATEFEWLGRFDSIINSGGIKLIPEKIEAKLAAIIKERFFVAGIPDEKLGEKLVLVIEGKPRKIDFSSLELTPYEIPKEVFYATKFVETENNKIQRKKTLNLLIK